MTTNGRVVNGNGAKAEKPPSSFLNPGTDDLEDYQAALEQAITESLAMQEAEARFGNPGKAGIAVRHDQGLFHRENPEDRKRYEAGKANHDRKVLSADHITELGGFIVSGEQFVLDVAEHLAKRNAARPDSVKPLGHMLTKTCMQVLSGALIESVKHNAERGTQEIDLATRPKQQ
jgi:hypothetical protein